MSDQNGSSGDGSSGAAAAGAVLGGVAKNRNVRESDGASDVPEILRPPEVLYHYTTAAGIQGILESGSLWATDLRFLNDERELDYGLKMALPRFRDEVLARSDERLTRAIVDQILAAERRSRYFATCFCEEGDLLSQWRGYGLPGGYAVGLDTSARSNMIRQSLDYSRIWYDNKMVEHLATAWARMAADDFISAFGEPLRDALALLAEEDRTEELAKRLYEFDSNGFSRLERTCAILKHPSFSEEREWRILSHWSMSQRESPTIEFRQGSLGLTPYIQLDMRVEGGLLPLKEVVVGPGGDMQLRVSAIRMFLSKLGYDDETVEVRSSEIPFRG